LNRKICILCLLNRLSLIVATSSDFSSLSSVPLVFPPTSVNGTQRCASLNATEDNLVECEEDFTVLLNLTTAGDGFRLGNAATIVSITDNDGMRVACTIALGTYIFR
jgi:hypothetical protein